MTLVETMVALVIASLVVVVAHALFTQVMDGAERARTAAHAADRWAARRDWLVRVFASLEVDAERHWGFVGTSGNGTASIAFVTGARTGVKAPARVELGNGEWGMGNGVKRLEAHVRALGVDSAQALEFVLADSIASFDADFLLEYGARARWVHTWVSPATAPLAARLRIGFGGGAVDTLVLRIGPRG